MSGQPLYDIYQDWEANLQHGPFWVNDLPQLPERNPRRFSFLGYGLNSLLGIPACPLTANASFVELCSRLGFDLLTYKSVRSIPWSGNVFPHWLYVDAQPEADLRASERSLTAYPEAVENQEISMANSFGVHSLSPLAWQRDYEAARKVLLAGQLLILSVMPSRIEGKTLVDDAKKLARLAAETPAEAVEVNFACPNTDGGKGLIYEDLALTYHICAEMHSLLRGKHLLAKVGYFKNQGILRRFMEQTKGIISGISSMNTYSMKIVTPEGKEAFPGRPTAGVSGASIRPIALEQAQNIVKFRQELGLTDKFVIIGIGGVTSPEHVDQYLEIGVDAVQTAVGAWSNPFLASKYLNSH